MGRGEGRRSVTGERRVSWRRVLVAVGVVVALGGAGAVVYFMSHLGFSVVTDRMAEAISPSRGLVARATCSSAGAIGGTYSEVKVYPANDTSWAAGDQVWESWKLIPHELVWASKDSLLVVIQGPLMHPDSLSKPMYEARGSELARVSTWVRTGRVLTALEASRP